MMLVMPILGGTEQNLLLALAIVLEEAIPFAAIPSVQPSTYLIICSGYVLDN